MTSMSQRQRHLRGDLHAKEMMIVSGSHVTETASARRRNIGTDMELERGTDMQLQKLQDKAANTRMQTHRKPRMPACTEVCKRDCVRVYTCI